VSETVTNLIAAVEQLSIDEKKQFILQALPGLGGEAVKDPNFLPQLLPVFLGLIRQSGVDLGQLLQLANMLGATAPSPGKD
jgi:hypothetical protein